MYMQLQLWHDFYNTVLKSNITYVASGSAPALNKKLWVRVYSGQLIVYFLKEVTTASFQFSFHHSLHHFPQHKVCILKIILNKLRNNARTDPTRQVNSAHRSEDSCRAGPVNKLLMMGRGTARNM